MFNTIFFLVFFNTLVGVRTVPRIFEHAVRTLGGSPPPRDLPRPDPRGPAQHRDRHPHEHRVRLARAHRRRDDRDQHRARLPHLQRRRTSTRRTPSSWGSSPSALLWLATDRLRPAAAGAPDSGALGSGVNGAVSALPRRTIVFLGVAAAAGAGWEAFIRLSARRRHRRRAGAAHCGRTLGQHRGDAAASRPKTSTSGCSRAMAS